jgi:hypothetical protein
MKNTVFIILAAGILAMAGCADLAKLPLAPTATSRTAALTYQTLSEGSSVPRTRDLSVEIPASIKYKNNYFRQFVAIYISTYNVGLSHQADFWTVSKDSFAKENVVFYRAEALKPIRDKDTLAPEDIVPAYDYMKGDSDSQAALLDAQTLAQKHLHDLLKQERK